MKAVRLWSIVMLTLLGAVAGFAFAAIAADLVCPARFNQLGKEDVQPARVAVSWTVFLLCTITPPIGYDYVMRRGQS